MYRINKEINFIIMMIPFLINLNKEKVQNNKKFSLKKKLFVILMF